MEAQESKVTNWDLELIKAAADGDAPVKLKAAPELRTALRNVGIWLPDESKRDEIERLSKFWLAFNGHT